MVLLSQELGFEHHVTTAYSAWSNGSAEHMNKELIKLCRKVLSQKKLPKKSWLMVMPIVNYGINHAPSMLLGGCCLIEVAFGSTPKPPVELSMFRGARAKNHPLPSITGILGKPPRCWKEWSGDPPASWVLD